MRAILLKASVTGALCAMLAVLAASAATTPAPPDPYQPFAFLLGHCWKGSFANNTQTDEHCFSRIYGGRFLRDEHVVRAAQGGAERFHGETIYVWNAATRQLEYLYIESTGGFIRGTAAVEGDTLVFPQAGYVGTDGKSMSVRSRWQRAGDDAYDTATEFEVEGRWVPAFALHMQRLRQSR